jgi:uncharacterized membrane protein (UPF0127 family)
MTNQKKKTQPKHSNKKEIDKKYYLIAGVLIATIIILFVFPGILNKKNSEEVYYMFQKEGELTISDSTNSIKAKIDVEIADTDYERQLGLMKRVSMEEKQGMLFIFPADAMQSFWMRNTLISLDMIFINSNKEIVTIQKNTKVLSDQSYPSTAPAKFVLEVNGGFTDKYKIVVGDVINWKVAR